MARDSNPQDESGILISFAQLTRYESVIRAKCEAECRTRVLKEVGRWIDKNKHLFLGNFRAGDNLGDFIESLEKGILPQGRV